MAILDYRQEQGKLPAGSVARGHQYRGLTFLNPDNPQVDEVTFTTGEALAWSVVVANDDTGESAPALSFLPATASVTDAAIAFLNAWNKTPANLKFARAVSISAGVVELRYASSRFDYTSTITPPGGPGAETTVVAAESGFNVFYGHWAFRTLTADIVTTEDGRTLVNPLGAGNVLVNVAGLTVRELTNENPDLARSSTITRGNYTAGSDVPVMRQGNIFVPVTVAVKPGDAVHAIIAGANAGKTTNTGAIDMSSIAQFMSVAAIGENAEVQISLA